MKRLQLNRNLLILGAILMLIMLGYGMVMPIFPFYIERLGASGSELGLLLALSPFMQLIFAPLWGRVSDRRGRKPVLMIGFLGYGISLFLFGLATELWMLFVIRGLGSILSAATLPATFAYVGDSTAAEERGGGMGFLGAASGAGMIFGPAFGGLLATDNLALPFFATSAVIILTLPIVYFFLPESLPGEQEQAPPSAPPAARPAGLRALRHYATGPIGVLLFLAFLVSFALTIFQGVFGLYALERFGYGTEGVGWILTVMGLAVVVAQGALAGPLTKRYGEAAVIKTTLPAGALSFLLLLLADGYTAVLVTTALFAVPNALLRTAVMARTSQEAGEQQGTIMGLNSSATSLGRVAGPIWGGFVFDINILLPYISGALILLATFLFSLFAVKDAARASAEEPERAAALRERHADGP